MNNTIDCNECFPNKPIPERAYVTLNKDKKNTDVDLFCVINKAIEQGLINVTNSTDTFSTLNNQVITFPDGQTLTVPSQADLNSLETQIQNNDTDIQNLQTELNNLSHPSIQSVDFKPTGNPNEYTIDLLWTDEDGNVNTVTDSTPVTITPSENAKSFTQINSTVIPNTPVDPTLTFDANQPLVEGTQVNQIYTDGVVTSTYNGAVWTNTITNREHKDGNILWVSTNGNDSTAQKGNQHYPYKTIKNALTSSVSGDTVIVLPGLYKETPTVVIPGSITIECLGGVFVEGLAGISTPSVNASFTLKGGTWNIEGYFLFNARYRNIDIDIRLSELDSSGNKKELSQLVRATGNTLPITQNIKISNSIFNSSFSLVDNYHNSSEKLNTKLILSNCTITANREAPFSFIRQHHLSGNKKSHSLLVFENCTVTYNVTNSDWRGLITLYRSSANALHIDTTAHIKATNTKFLNSVPLPANLPLDYAGLAGCFGGFFNTTPTVDNCKITVDFNNVESDHPILYRRGNVTKAGILNTTYVINLNNYTQLSKQVIWLQSQNTSDYTGTSYKIKGSKVKTGVQPNYTALNAEEVIDFEGDYANNSIPFLQTTSAVNLKNIKVVFDDPTQTTALVVDNTSANPINIYCQSVSTNTLQDDPTVTEKLEPILRDANLK